MVAERMLDRAVRKKSGNRHREWAIHNRQDLLIADKQNVSLGRVVGGQLLFGEEFFGLYARPQAPILDIGEAGLNCD